MICGYDAPANLKKWILFRRYYYAPAINFKKCTFSEYVLHTYTVSVLTPASLFSYNLRLCYILYTRKFFRKGVGVISNHILHTLIKQIMS